MCMQARIILIEELPAKLSGGDPGIGLVRADPATALKAEQQIESCEYCHPDDAEIPFDFVSGLSDSKAGPMEIEIAR